MLLSDGPRQSINALTLYAVYLSKKNNRGPWYDPTKYFRGNTVIATALTLSTLLTVLIFAGSLLLLIVAALLYMPLLCHIRGNLKEYCCHKVDKVRTIGSSPRRYQISNVRSCSVLPKSSGAGTSRGNNGPRSSLRRRPLETFRTLRIRRARLLESLSPSPHYPCYLWMMTWAIFLRLNTAVLLAPLTAITVIRRVSSPTIRLYLHITNHTPTIKHPVTLSITLQCQPYMMIDTTMKRGARLTWRQRPLPSLVVEALISITDTLRTTTTSITAATRRTDMDNRRITRNLRGRPPLHTILTLKILTRALKEMRTEMSRITSNRGTDEQCNRLGAGCSSTLRYLSCVYRSQLSSGSLSS